MFIIEYDMEKHYNSTYHIIILSLLQQGVFVFQHLITAVCLHHSWPQLMSGRCVKVWEHLGATLYRPKQKMDKNGHGRSDFITGPQFWHSNEMKMIQTWSNHQSEKKKQRIIAMGQNVGTTVNPKVVDK